MSRYLSFFGQYYRRGLTIPEIMNLITDWLGVDEYFYHAISLGVNPCELRRIGNEPWEKCFRRAVLAAENAEKKILLHNASVALTKEREIASQSGVIIPMRAENIVAYPSASDPYMPMYMRQVLSHIHDEDKPKVEPKCEVKYEVFSALREMGRL